MRKALISGVSRSLHGLHPESGFMILTVHSRPPLDVPHKHHSLQASSSSGAVHSVHMFALTRTLVRMDMLVCDWQS